ncbi:MAG: CDP-alcohol phosphatidyltransferase family protein [Acidimicrobiia bacterium]
MLETTSTEQHRDTSLYGIKPGFVRLLDPIRKSLARRGVSPTTVTLAAVPVELTVAACLVIGVRAPFVLLLVPVLAVAWMALNALDGSLARATGGVTSVGTVLNELVDRFGDLVVVSVAFIVAPLPVAAGLGVAILSSELVAAIGWATTGHRHFRGPMGKPDRAAVLAVGSLAAIIWPGALTVAFVVIGVGAAIGLGVRTRAVIDVAHAIDVGDDR